MDSPIEYESQEKVELSLQSRVTLQDILTAVVLGHCLNPRDTLNCGLVGIGSRRI